MKKTSHSLNYEVRLSFDPEDKIYIARVPELQGVHSNGSTQEEALENVKEVIALHLQVLEEDGEDIPVPLSERDFSGQMPLRMGKDVHRDLVTTAKAENKSANELAVEAVKSYIYRKNAQSKWDARTSDESQFMPTKMFAKKAASVGHMGIKKTTKKKRA
jgi:predicted RNase H-like HicB family nuclease